MTDTDTDAFVQDWEVWHRQHETVRADPHGFLAITGLHWLTGEPRRFPEAPGEWWSGSDVVRPRHPGNQVLRDYPGTPAYAPDPRWALTGRHVPFDEPRPTTVGAVVEGLQHVYDAPGRIEFVLDGQPLTLTAFNGPTPGSLFVLFTDATSGVTTYAANRSLMIDPPAADGTVTLDFNRATNLPCAYTAFATCPLPPAENHLPVAVEAGEQKPLG